MLMLLTTHDNPYDPRDQFEDWLKYDELNGYHTCELLDQVCFTSKGLGDELNKGIIERGMIELVQNDTTNNLYIKTYDDTDN